MFLGIDSDSGRILEGLSTTNGRILPEMPVISPCRLTTDKKDLSEGAGSADISNRIYFREDFYDPRSRLRRGRLYKACENFNQSWMIMEVVGGGGREV